MVQGFDSSKYAAMGESQRVRTITLPAERGAIFDRRGQELAMSVTQQSIWVNPSLVTDPLAAAGALAPILGEDIPTLQERLTRSGSFVYLARKVDDSIAEKVKELALPGVAFVPESKRMLPAGELATPVLGSVGLDNEGLSGLERQFETRLAGRPGRLVVEKDPGGREIAGGQRDYQPSTRGEDLVLTIDRALQYEAERALAAEIVKAKAKGGTAIAMETATGEILALANLRASEDDTGPPVLPAIRNRAATDIFEPGSVNKLITIAGALEEGIVKPETTLTVASTIQVGKHTFSEHDPHPTVPWSVTEIMANSSNVGSIMIGQKLGKYGLDKYLRAFGFGTRTGLGIPGEAAGLLTDPDKWYSTDIATVPIGQGGVSVTALQMLAAYNTVANGGMYVAPRLVKATVDADGREVPEPPSTRRRVVSTRTAEQVTKMLEEVVRSGTGTLAAIPGYSVAGKTGTARKPAEGVRGYKAGAYVSSFAGFVPAERPAITAIIILDEPTPIFGGLVAAPVFAEIARYGLREFRVPPPAKPPAPTAPAPAAAAQDGDVPVSTTTPGRPTGANVDAAPRPRTP